MHQALIQANVSSITAAMRASKTIMFTYTDAKGNVSDRHVEPYEIKMGKVYTHDLGRNASRQYFVDQMSDIREGNNFSPRWPIVVV